MSSSKLLIMKIRILKPFAVIRPLNSQCYMEFLSLGEKWPWLPKLSKLDCTSWRSGYQNIKGSKHGGISQRSLRSYLPFNDLFGSVIRWLLPCSTRYYSHADGQVSVRVFLCFQRKFQFLLQVFKPRSFYSVFKDVCHRVEMNQDLFFKSENKSFLWRLILNILYS